LDIDLDHSKVNHDLTGSIGEPTPFLEDKVEDMGTLLSSLREVEVYDAPLGGTRNHEIDTSYSDKE